MQKKSFVAPFWFLLVLGIILLLFVSLYVSVTLRNASAYPRYAPRIFYWRIFMWPVIILIEALVYWRIRRRINYRMLSWAHVGILIFAFLANILLAMSGILHNHFFSGPNVSVDRLVTARLQIRLFWVFVGIAHCFFVWLIVNCFRKKAPVAVEGAGGENILDDVIL
jgi:hypothetical protein